MHLNEEGRMNKRLYYYDEDGFKQKGANPDLKGNCSGLYGDCTGLYGNCSGLYGDCTGLFGNCLGLFGDCSGIYGDCTKLLGDCTGMYGYCSGLCISFDKYRFTSKERQEGIDIKIFNSDRDYKTIVQQ